MCDRSSLGRDSRREAGMVGVVVAVVGTGRDAWIGIEEGVGEASDVRRAE
jgi:hypothetical protein